MQRGAIDMDERAQVHEGGHLSGVGVRVSGQWEGEVRRAAVGGGGESGAGEARARVRVRVRQRQAASSKQQASDEAVT